MPRTQTNDGTSPVGPNAHRFASLRNIQSNQSLYAVTAQNVNAVIVAMDIVHTSGASGDVCGIQIPSNGAVIFGGFTGAGLDDTFSWRGMIVLYPGESIGAFVVTGSWDFSASGYYQPFLEHSV